MAACLTCFVNRVAIHLFDWLICYFTSIGWTSMMCIKVMGGMREKIHNPALTDLQCSCEDQMHSYEMWNTETVRSEPWAPKSLGIVFFPPHHYRDTLESHQNTWGQWKSTQCHLSFLLRETEHRSQSTSPHFCSSYQLKDILLSTSLFFCDSFSITLEKLVLSLLFLFFPFLISSFVLQIKPNYDQDLKLGFIMTWKSKLINFELKLQMIKN